VQGTVAASGWRRAARSAWETQAGARARSERPRLAERSGRAFWCEHSRTYALDARRQQAAVQGAFLERRASSVQRAIVREDRARRVAADLMRPAFFPGWGIAPWTLGARQRLQSDDPITNGSLLATDNAMITTRFAAMAGSIRSNSVSGDLFDAASPIGTADVC